MLRFDSSLKRSSAASVQKSRLRSCWKVPVKQSVLLKQRKSVCHSSRDPLEGEIWKSWSGREAEWETEKFAEDELVDILFEVNFSPCHASRICPMANRNQCNRHTLCLALCGGEMQPVVQ